MYKDPISAPRTRPFFLRTVYSEATERQRDREEWKKAQDRNCRETQAKLPLNSAAFRLSDSSASEKLLRETQISSISSLYFIGFQQVWYAFQLNSTKFFRNSSSEVSFFGLLLSRSGSSNILDCFLEWRNSLFFFSYGFEFRICDFVELSNLEFVLRNMVVDLLHFGLDRMNSITVWGVLCWVEIWCFSMFGSGENRRKGRELKGFWMRCSLLEGFLRIGFWSKCVEIVLEFA